MTSLFLTRRLPPALRLAIFSVLTLIVTLASRGDDQALRGFLLNLVYPVQAVTRTLQSGWGYLADALQSRAMLAEENARLKRQLAAAQPKLLRMSTLEVENRQLLALLDTLPQPPGRLLVAQVTGQSSNPGSQILTLNQGRTSGVYVGQPVLGPDGVIGQIVTVGTFSSQLALLSDPDSSLPAMAIGTDTLVLVNGTGTPTRLAIPFQPHNTPLYPGQVLVTSGLGGRFPAGLPVGRILTVHRGGGEPFARITVSPAAPLDRLSKVLLLWPAPPAAPARS